MATITITEFGDPNTRGLKSNQVSPGFPVLDGAPIAEQSPVTIGAKALSAAFNANTRVIALVARTACYVKVGAAASTEVTLSSFYLPANVIQFFAVTPAAKVAVWDGTT